MEKGACFLLIQRQEIRQNVRLCTYSANQKDMLSNDNSFFPNYAYSYKQQ